MVFDICIPQGPVSLCTPSPAQRRRAHSTRWESRGVSQEGKQEPSPGPGCQRWAIRYGPSWSWQPAISDKSGTKSWQSCGSPMDISYQCSCGQQWQHLLSPHLCLLVIQRTTCTLPHVVTMLTLCYCFKHPSPSCAAHRPQHHLWLHRVSAAALPTAWVSQREWGQVPAGGTPREGCGQLSAQQFAPFQTPNSGENFRSNTSSQVFSDIHTTKLFPGAITNCNTTAGSSWKYWKHFIRVQIPTEERNGRNMHQGWEKAAPRQTKCI